MKIFIARVSGFDPTRFPVVTFSLEGNRDNLLRETSVGDCIVLVGTLRDPTPHAMRGRLLGMAEIGRHAIDTDAISTFAIAAHEFSQLGLLPKEILMARAWRFDPQPLLLDVLADYLPYHATCQTVLLSPVDVEAVSSLSKFELDISGQYRTRKTRGARYCARINRAYHRPWTDLMERGFRARRPAASFHLCIQVREDRYLENWPCSGRRKAAETGELAYPL